MSSEEQQAALLEQYYAALARDENASPTPGLDANRAAVARRLHREIQGQKPTAAFRQQLRQRLEAEASLVKSADSPRSAGGKERAKMENATTFRPLSRLGSVFGRLATVLIIVGLLIGSIAVANDLIKRQQNNVVIAPPPATAQTAAVTALATPCTNVLGAWHSASGFSSTTSVGAAASDGTYVYAVGGNFTLSSLNPSNQLLRYDPAADKWTALANAPDSFAVGSAVYSPINKKLYVFGGTHGPSMGSGTLIADTRIYDPASNSWSGGAPMPNAQFLMASGYWDGKIYLTGGVASLTSVNIKDQTWVYDPLANTWATRTPRPAAGSGFGYGIINGHFYTTGGYYPVSGGFTSATYDYDIAADRWTARANLPRAIDYPGSAVVGSRLYVFGGIYGNGVVEQSQTYVYDPATDAWANGPDMAAPRMLPVGASVGNTLLAIGGSNLGQLLNSVEAAAITCAVAPPAATPPPQHASTDNPYTFPQTGKIIGGKFRTYWEQHGGLAQQGYPISNEFQEVSDLDGKTYSVQYFERAVMELHPQNDAPYDVLLSQLGSFRYKQKYPNGAPNQAVNTNNPYKFAQTGFTVGGKFRAYWEQHGGLAQQGYPISNEFQEVSDLDGKTYTVQYFERAVFELHPENAGTAYEVELSQLGRFQYKQKYPTAP